jgi:hypothetical protein
MSFVEAPGVAQITLKGRYNSQEDIVNVIHVAKKNDAVFAPWTNQQLLDAILRVGLAWQRFLPRLASVAKWTEISGRDLTTEQGVVALNPVSMTGGASGTPAPPSVSFLVQWRTGRAGRGANGRNYIPGVNEAFVDEMGRFGQGEIDTWAPICAGILSDLGGATSTILPGAPLDLVILHKPKSPAITRAGAPVITGRLSNVMGSQRRRLPRRA